MINCEIQSLLAFESELTLQKYLGSLIENPRKIITQPREGISNYSRERMLGWLKVAKKIAEEFEADILLKRTSRFKRKLSAESINYREFYNEIIVLKDAFNDDMREHFIYRYPSERAKVYSNWKKDWQPVIERFQKVDRDISAGVDLWALAHYTASVFQFMRVLEVGLEELSKDVGVVYSVQTWQGIINEIEKAIRLESQKRNSPQKQTRLQFLSEAAKEFVYFKDGWRNYVSHNKCEYEERQARDVMEHVRSFMIKLANNL